MESGHQGRAAAYPVMRTPRRPLILMAVGAVVCFVIFLTTASTSAALADASRAAVREAAASISRYRIPTGRFRFGDGAPRAHDPPGPLRNSSSGDTSWYNAWDWRHPFSATVSFDEERSVLPQPAERPPVYTYYDAAEDKPAAVREAERELLLVWRRAWWAQGFRPVILGRAEAMKNLRYESLQAAQPQPAVRDELLRWLAWGHMGRGVLANWLVLPMAPRDDHDLAALRRGRFPRLTRYEDLGAGLFHGPAEAVDRTLAQVLRSPRLPEYKTFLDAAAEEPDAFALDPKPPGLAFYHGPTIAALYPAIGDALQQDRARGLRELARLATAHLHATFLAAHAGGLEVLDAHTPHADLLAAPATALAAALNTCPSSPAPGSCPPNRQPPQRACTPCAPLSVAYPEALANRSDVLSLVAVPHPYTLALLLRARPALDVPSVRRSSERDPWLGRATRDLHGDAISAYERVGRLKEAVAGAAPRAALWRTAERPWAWRELEWHFGFALPRDAGAPADLRVAARPERDDPVLLAPLLRHVRPRPQVRALAQQWELLEEAKKVVLRGRRHGWSAKGEVDMRAVIEAWHLADAEAWRFVRALEARERVEWEAWERVERKVSGAMVEKD